MRKDARIRVVSSIEGKWWYEAQHCRPHPSVLNGNAYSGPTACTYNDNVELEPVQLARPALEVSTDGPHLLRLEALVRRLRVVAVYGRLADIYSYDCLHVLTEIPGDISFNCNQELTRAQESRDGPQTCPASIIHRDRLVLVEELGPRLAHRCDVSSS